MGGWVGGLVGGWLGGWVGGWLYELENITNSASNSVKVGAGAELGKKLQE